MLPFTARTVSKTTKAGITFSVGRVRRFLKNGNYANRIGVGSAVYAATVLEYLVAEILELAGNEAEKHKRKTINPRHIMLAIKQDEELNNLLQNVTISNSGVPSQIHPSLLVNKKQRK